MEHSVRVLRPRLLALGMYVCYFMAALVFVLFPSTTSARSDMSFFALFIWHSFMLLGSCISAAGVVRKRPALEAVGIPLLASALTGYIVVMLASDQIEGTRYGLSFLFFSTVLGLSGRMYEILALARIAADLNRRGE